MSANETVAAHLAASLPEMGVTHVFELVGGMITVLLDVLHQNPQLHVVSMHHEQGAGFAAEAFARTTGRPAVALATSGPGATNLLTAIGSCYFDSSPVVFITGQVNRDELRRDGQGRQGGFQETDIVAMARTVTKSATLVEEPEKFPQQLAEAFRIATSGRPGPVLLDIPMDVQRAVIPESSTGPGSSLEQKPSNRARNDDRSKFLGRLSGALRQADRPLVLAGGGLRAAGVVDEFRRATTAWSIPVVTSLMGIDSIPATAAERVGFLGSYGNRWANWAVAQSDLLLVLGSRLDVRQTGSDIDGFRGGRAIFHVDVDAAELNYHVPGCEVLQDDLSVFVPEARTSLESVWPGNDAWRADIEARRRMWPDSAENVPETGINPNLAVRELNNLWKDVSVYVTDVGQHQMWAAQSIQLTGEQRFLTSGGMGSMGFGLPAAVGAALARPSDTVCLIAGDGGFQCNIQELQTVARHQLPLRIVIFDNGCHGMVRQFQESYFESRYYSTRWGYSAPDFSAVAEGYGIPARRVDSHESWRSALDEVASLTGGPSLIHVDIDGDLNAYPKMAFGQPFGSMEPFVSPLEMEGT